MRFIVWFLLSLVLMASACGPASGTVAPTPAPATPTGTVAPTPVPATPTGAADALANTQWQLISFGPAGTESPVLAGTTITLEFGTGGQAGGLAGCNQYGSAYQFQGDTLSFGEITRTLRTCEDTDMMQQEERYLQALASAHGFERVGDQLAIRYDEGQGVLTFVKSAASTATPPPATEVPRTSTPRRIEFKPGSTSAMVRGQLPAFGVDAWVLHAQAGQTLSVALETSTGQAYLVIWGADGTLLISDYAGAAQFNGLLPATQYYNIHVRAGLDGPAVYTMRVTIPPLDGAAWTRQQFGDAWDIAYPESWTVNAAGAHEGALWLEGPYGEHRYAITLSYPIGISATSLDAWVEEQLASLSPPLRSAVVVRDATVAGAPAKVLAGIPGADGEHSTSQVVIWRDGDTNPRLITIAQVDDGPFDPEAMAALLDRFLADIRA